MEYPSSSEFALKNLLLASLFLLPLMPTSARAQTGLGCPGGSGVVPHFEFRSDVKPDLTVRADVYGTPSSACFLIAGTNSNSWAGAALPLALSEIDSGFGSCVLYQDPAVLIPLSLDSQGHALVEFKGWGLGLEVFLQLWNLDPPGVPVASFGGFSPGYSETSEDLGPELFPSSSIQPNLGALEMASGDVNGDGVVDVLQLGNPENVVFIRPGLGGGLLGDAETFALSTQAEQLLVRDFDGDGNLDFSVVHPPHGLRVHTGDGTGSFTANYTANLGGDPIEHLAVPDLDGDGDLDLLAVTRTYSDPSPKLRIALGAGDGNFAAPVTTDLPGEIQQVWPVDLNTDGLLDLLVSAEAAPGTGRVWVYFSESAGVLGYGTEVAFPGPVESLASGDLDGDSFPEWIASIPSTAQVFVISGSASGLGAVQELPHALTGQALLGDLEQDGDLDLVVAGADTTAVLLGAGDGAFASPTMSDFGIGSDARLVEVSSDGIPDLVGGEFRVAKSDGSGGFQDVENYPTAYTESATELVDLDGDSALDRLILNVHGNLSWMRNEGDGAFAVFQTASGAPTGFGVSVDLDGDEYADLITTSVSAVATWRGSSEGFELLKTLDLPDNQGPTDVTLEDYDLDGYPDLLVVGWSGRMILVRGDSIENGGLKSTEVLYHFTGQARVAAGFFNADPYPDYVKRWSTSTTQMTLYAGLGDGQFQQSGHTQIGQVFDDLYVADLDLDGDGDVVLRSTATDSTWVQRCSGDGTFQASEPIVGLGGSLLQLSDIDGDGDTDVVQVHSTAILVALNDGLGNFGPVLEQPIVESPAGYTLANLADVNLDGHLDLWIGASSSKLEYIYLGAGDGSFSPTPAFTLPSNQNWIGTRVLADVDGDGPPDLVASNSNGNGTTLLLVRNLLLH